MYISYHLYITRAIDDLLEAQCDNRKFEERKCLIIF